MAYTQVLILVFIIKKNFYLVVSSFYVFGLMPCPWLDISVPRIANLLGNNVSTLISSHMTKLWTFSLREIPTSETLDTSWESDLFLLEMSIPSISCWENTASDLEELILILAARNHH